MDSNRLNTDRAIQFTTPWSQRDCTVQVASISTPPILLLTRWNQTHDCESMADGRRRPGDHASRTGPSQAPIAQIAPFTVFCRAAMLASPGASGLQSRATSPPPPSLPGWLRGAARQLLIATFVVATPSSERGAAAAGGGGLWHRRFGRCLAIEQRARPSPPGHAVRGR